MRQSVRDLLLCFATATYEQRPVPTGVDWEEARIAARYHGLIPLANYFLRHAGDAAPSEFKSLVYRDYLTSVAQSIHRTYEFHLVLQALRDAGLSALVLKGPALTATVYPEPTLRPFNDLDLVCREEDWVAVHKAMLALGFAPVLNQGTPPPRIWDRRAHHHMVYVNPKQIAVEVHFGDLWQIGLRPRLEQQYWERAIPATIAGVQTRILAPADQVLHLCVHLHKHHYARLIWFVDLALLLQSFGERIDWSCLVRTAHAEDVTASVYYSLYYVQRLLNVAAPAVQLAALKPGSVRAALHRRRWPDQRVLQFTLPKRKDFKMPEVPSASELLFNLLLMGRTREKLHYYLRVLVPPRAWLSTYTGTVDHREIRRRYLVHGPKVLLLGARGLFFAAYHYLTGRCRNPVENV